MALKYNPKCGECIDHENDCTCSCHKFPDMHFDEHYSFDNVPSESLNG